MQNISYENEFPLHGNEHVRRTRFHMNGFVSKKIRFNTKAKDNSEMSY